MRGNQALVLRTSHARAVVYTHQHSALPQVPCYSRSFAPSRLPDAPTGRRCLRLPNPARARLRVSASSSPNGIFNAALHRTFTMSSFRSHADNNIITCIYTANLLNVLYWIGSARDGPIGTDTARPLLPPVSHRTPYLMGLPGPMTRFFASCVRGTKPPARLDAPFESPVKPLTQEWVTKAGDYLVARQIMRRRKTSHKGSARGQCAVGIIESRSSSRMPIGSSF